MENKFKEIDEKLQKARDGARAPDFKGNGVAVWINDGQYGRYASVQVLGGKAINCSVPRPKVEDPSTDGEKVA